VDYLIADEDACVGHEDTLVADEDYSARDEDGGIIARDYRGCHVQNSAQFIHFGKK
jgi:hypothetical protein